jgi:hypothetical protein
MDGDGFYRFYSVTFGGHVYSLVAVSTICRLRTDRVIASAWD